MKKLKIIIADDEKIVRMSLIKMIDWDRYGLCLLAECSNGEEVIQVVNDNMKDVDILLSDVMMPGMNGLELSVWMYENCPSCTVILFSGYSEYELLREAIRNHATDYILKPISRANLNQTLAEAIQKKESKKLDENIGWPRTDVIAIEIKRYIDINFTKSISLQQIADTFGYNSSYISRVFKQYTGCSILQYINRTRIEKAQKLLDENEKYRIIKLAEAVGVYDVDYFCKMFKKYSGKTPSQYKSNNKKKV